MLQWNSGYLFDRKLPCDDRSTTVSTSCQCHEENSNTGTVSIIGRCESQSWSMQRYNYLSDTLPNRLLYSVPRCDAWRAFIQLIGKYTKYGLPFERFPFEFTCGRRRDVDRVQGGRIKLLRRATAVTAYGLFGCCCFRLACHPSAAYWKWTARLGK